MIPPTPYAPPTSGPYSAASMNRHGSGGAIGNEMLDAMSGKGTTVPPQAPTTAPSQTDQAGAGSFQKYYQEMLGQNGKQYDFAMQSAMQALGLPPYQPGTPGAGGGYSGGGVSGPVQVQ